MDTSSDFDEFVWDDDGMPESCARAQAEQRAMKDYEDGHPNSVRWTYDRLRETALALKGTDE